MISQARYAAVDASGRPLSDNLPSYHHLVMTGDKAGAQQTPFFRALSERDLDENTYRYLALSAFDLVPESWPAALQSLKDEIHKILAGHPLDDGLCHTIVQSVAPSMSDVDRDRVIGNFRQYNGSLSVGEKAGILARLIRSGLQYLGLEAELRWPFLDTAARCVAGHILSGKATTVAPEWLIPRVGKLARQICEEQYYELLPELADCLEQAGCLDGCILNHCRMTADSHRAGCFVPRLILQAVDVRASGPA